MDCSSGDIVNSSYAATHGISLGIMYLSIFLIASPYFYYFYKWCINFKYKTYHIRLKADSWTSTGIIALQLFLSFITLGIYLPLACLKLYKYFLEHMAAESESSQKTFGYHLDAASDFGFLWEQGLLTLITLGVYYPWAYCKVTKRIMGKTYVEEECSVRAGECSGQLPL